MSVMTRTARRNPAIATGIAGALLGTVVGTSVTWIVVAAPQVAAPMQRAAGITDADVSEALRQHARIEYGAASAGDAGTDAAAVSTQQVSNMGQYDVDNMGGTPAAGAAGGTVSNMGQYDVDNMGGTPAAGAAGGTVSNMGQYDVDNMGGTPGRVRDHGRGD
jgi:hypothetical protein